MLLLPSRTPIFRWLVVAWSLYGVVWIGLEGELRQVLIMGVGAAVLVAGYGLLRWGRKRPLTLHTFLLACALFGLMAGLFSAPFTLFFMALKTGLHGHGPEYTLQEIEWVSRQIPIWSVSGLLSGLGLGLLLGAWQKNRGD